jgi:YihY family inner membrane protein
MQVREAFGWGRIVDALGEVEPRKLARQVLDDFREHQLLIAAGGIAFRVLLATVVGTLFVVGLLGFFGLSEVWHSDIAPDLRGSVSPAAFTVINDAVTHVLENKDVFWVTFGAAAAVWQISGVVRAAGQTLNRLYGAEERRSFGEELWSSIRTAAAVALILVATLAIVRLGPLAFDDLLGDSALVELVGFVIRWSLAAALLTLAVGLVVHAAPAIARPLPWVSFGSALTVAGWIASSLLLGLYLSAFASFGSVYGALLAVFLLVEYLYVAAIVFLGGLAVDRLVQQRASG